ncbi:MAG: CHASE2 domain-containing protein [Serpentinimonas sp.]|nr:CHASE2 domain-containing protein [Serpentinimonas sp.]
MKHLNQRAMAFWLSVLGLTLGLLLLVSDPLLLQTLRYQVFDQYQRWSPRVYAPQPVRIIDIDEASLQRVGQWPWPRTQVADMVQRLNEAGAAAIGLDILFIEPDRTSPQAVAQRWPLDPQTRQTLLQLPDHDALLGQTLADRHVVLGFSWQRALSG